MNNLKLLFKKKSYELLPKEKDLLNKIFFEYNELIKNNLESYFEIFYNSILNDSEYKKLIHGFIFLSIHDNSKLEKIESVYNYFIKNDSRNLNLLLDNLHFIYLNISDININLSFKFLKIIKISFFDILNLEKSENLIFLLLRTLNFNDISDFNYTNYFDFFNFLLINYDRAFPILKPNIIILLFHKIIRFLGLVQINLIFEDFEKILIELSQKILNDHFKICQSGGKELFLLIQDIIKNPKFYYLKEIFDSKEKVNQKINPNLKCNLISLNIPIYIEELILFILEKGNIESYNYQLNWILKEINFKSNTLSEIYIVDIIRYILCNTKDIYEDKNKFNLRRWIILGWCLNCMKSETIRVLAKQALFIDWIFFDENKDNFKDFKEIFIPIVELIYISSNKYPIISNELIQFLKFYSKEYDSNLQISFIFNNIFSTNENFRYFFLGENNLDKEIQLYLRSLVEKKTFNSNFVIENPNIDNIYKIQNNNNNKKDSENNFSEEEELNFSFDWEVLKNFGLFDNKNAKDIPNEILKIITNKFILKFLNDNEEILISDYFQAKNFLIILKKTFITENKKYYNENLELIKKFDIKNVLLYHLIIIGIFYFKTDLRIYQDYELFFCNILKGNKDYITDFLLIYYFYTDQQNYDKKIDDILLRILANNEIEIKQGIEKSVKWAFFSFREKNIYKFLLLLLNIIEKLNINLYGVISKFFFTVYNPFENNPITDENKMKLIEYFLKYPNRFFTDNLNCFQNISYLQFLLQKLVLKNIDRTENIDIILFKQIEFINLNVNTIEKLSSVLKVIFKLIYQSENEFKKIKSFQTLFYLSNDLNKYQLHFWKVTNKQFFQKSLRIYINTTLNNKSCVIKIKNFLKYLLKTKINYLLDSKNLNFDPTLYSKLKKKFQEFELDFDFDLKLN